ncbi:hypothetical protein GCM10027269_44300 [Kribbella endophytica]
MRKGSRRSGWGLWSSRPWDLTRCLWDLALRGTRRWGRRLKGKLRWGLRGRSMGRTGRKLGGRLGVGGRSRKLVDRRTTVGTTTRTAWWIGLRVGMFSGLG